MATAKRQLLSLLVIIPLFVLMIYVVTEVQQTSSVSGFKASPESFSEGGGCDKPPAASAAQPSVAPTQPAPSVQTKLSASELSDVPCMILPHGSAEKAHSEQVLKDDSTNIRKRFDEVVYHRNRVEIALACASERATDPDPDPN